MPDASVQTTRQHVRARKLEQIGIRAYDELLGADSVGVVGKLRERLCDVSLDQVERWKHHARSYCRSRPVVFGELPPLDGSFIALDLR